MSSRQRYFYFSEIDTETLVNNIIILDIDGTIVADGSDNVSSEVKTKLEKLVNTNSVFLLSNKKNHERNKKIADMVGAKYIETDIRKPSYKIIKLIENFNSQKVVVVGDKFLTDGLFSKNIKASFIKINHLTAPHESLFTRLSYWFDSLFFWIV